MWAFRVLSLGVHIRHHGPRRAHGRSLGHDHGHGLYHGLRDVGCCLWVVGMGARTTASSDAPIQVQWHSRCDCPSVPLRRMGCPDAALSAYALLGGGGGRVRHFPEAYMHATFRHVVAEPGPVT